jgi:hypothetical protein
LLDAYDRCRSDEDWKMLQLRLEDLLRGHGLRAMLENVTGEDSPVVDFRWPSAYRGPNDGGSSAAFGADLADVLRRICEQALSEPDLPPLTAYPEARIEGGVVASQPFWLEVMARADPTGMNTEPLVLQRPGSSQLAVEVVVDLPSDGSLVERSPLVHPLVIPEGRDSNRLSFELVAARPGQHQLKVLFFQRGLLILELPVHVSASEEGHPGSLNASSIIARGTLHEAESPSGLMLRVTADSGAHGPVKLRFTLGDYREGRSEMTSAQDLSGHWVDFVKHMRGIEADLHGLKNDEAREHRLRGIGERLADLLPRPIRDVLASTEYEEGTLLFIDVVGSENVWIPWEIMLLRTAAGERFLGEWFAVTQWPRLIHRDRVEQREAVLVSPLHSNLVTDTELKALESLTKKAPERLHSVAEVQKRLETGDSIGVLHFACHAMSTPDANLVLDEGSLSQNDVLRHVDGAPSPLYGACVFVNSCGAGAPTFHFHGHRGWAAAFMKAEVSAFIAPYWTVKDTSARIFAQIFYKSLAEGDTFARAVWRARRAINRSGYLERLGYSVYASPTARWA